MADAQLQLQSVGPLSIAEGQLDLNVTVNTGNPPLGLVQQYTISGNTTISVPSGAYLAIIEPSTTNTTSYTLKGVSGDTGIILQPALPWFLSLDYTVTTSFVLYCATSVTITITWL